MAEAAPAQVSHFVTRIEPEMVGDEGDAQFGPIMVRAVNYAGDDGSNHIVVAIRATEPGDYRVMFEGEISDVVKSTPTGEVVEGYLHFHGEWPSS